MRFLVLISLIVYCVLPLWFYNIGRYPLVYIFVIFIVSGFFFGAYTRLPASPLGLNGPSRAPVIAFRTKRLALYIIILFVAYYGWTVIGNDLLFRRNGTGQMIQVLLKLSLFDFLVIRGGDYLLPILSIAWLLLYKSDPSKRNAVVLVLLLGSAIVFTGSLYSRRNLMLLVLYALIVTGKLDIKSLTNPKFYLASIIFLFFILIYTAALRSSEANVMFEEIVGRLNGLKYLAVLDDLNRLFLTGSYDVSGYKYLMANLPLHEKAIEYKLNGTTSYKGYVLQDILELKQKDGVWSIIVDIGYVFGVLGLILMSYFLGYVSKWVDRTISRYRAKSGIGRHGWVVSLALIFSMTNIEGEFFGNMIGFMRLYIILYVGSFFLFSVSNAKRAGYS